MSILVRIVEIAHHTLADGGAIRVARVGRTYSFTRSYATLSEPPEVVFGLSKAAAMSRWVRAVRADVLELDDGGQL